MSKCPNCDGAVEFDDNYCGSCGKRLETVVRFKPGLLSSDSKDYLTREMRLTGDVDTESEEYERMLNEVGRAIADFTYLGPLPSFSLFQILDKESIDLFLEFAEDDSLDDIDDEELLRCTEPMLKLIGILNLQKIVADQIPKGSEVEKVDGFRDLPIDIYEFLSKYNE